MMLNISSLMEMKRKRHGWAFSREKTWCSIHFHILSLNNITIIIPTCRFQREKICVNNGTFSTTSQFFIRFVSMRMSRWKIFIVKLCYNFPFRIILLVFEFRNWETVIDTRRAFWCSFASHFFQHKLFSLSHESFFGEF